MYTTYAYSTEKAMSDASSTIGEPLAAWNQQSGGQTFNVIFDGKVYQNQYWVERWHCPGQAGTAASPHNAWESLRDATGEEIAELGNPTDCTVGPTTNKTDVLQADPLTEQTYGQVGYKPDGSGTNLSYTASRVCFSMYNDYYPDKNRPKVSAYITDWCQFDGRLDGLTDPNDTDTHSRGFDLNSIPATAYDKLVFSFLAVCGDHGPLKDKVQEVVNGWNVQVSEADKIRNGHMVPVDPYADLATTRNVGLPDEAGHPGVGPDNFLLYYNQESAAGLLGGLREMQERARLAGHRLKLAFSIGGWSLSSYFSTMVSRPVERQRFIDSIIDFFIRFPMFSGVDIDWEYPGGGGLDGNDYDEENDGPNYALLIKELRTALDSRFGAHNRKEITIAASAVVSKMEKSNLADLINNGLDNIFLMSYDLFGTGWAEYIGHHTNLKSPTGATPGGDYDLSAEVAINYLIDDLQIPSQKIQLGYANYGRACLGANLEDRTYNREGEALGTFELGAPELFDIFNNYFDVEYELAVGKNGFVLMTDTIADADVLYNENGGHYISLDTPRTVKQKAEYAASRNLGGIFSWSGDQDCGLLANAAREGAGYIASRETIDMGPIYNPGEPIELKPINPE